MSVSEVLKPSSLPSRRSSIESSRSTLAKSTSSSRTKSVVSDLVPPDGLFDDPNLLAALEFKSPLGRVEALSQRGKDIDQKRTLTYLCSRDPPRDQVRRVFEIPSFDQDVLGIPRGRYE